MFNTQSPAVWTVGLLMLHLWDVGVHDRLPLCIRSWADEAYRLKQTLIKRILIDLKH